MIDASSRSQGDAIFNWWGDPFSDKGIRYTWELDPMSPMCLGLRVFKSILGCLGEKEERQYRGIAREVEKRRSIGLFEATILVFAQESARFRDGVINAVRGDMDATQADRATSVVEHPFDMDEKQFKLLMPEDRLAAAGGALLNIHDHFYYTDYPIAPHSFTYTGSPVGQERMAPQPPVARFMLELIDIEVKRRHISLSIVELGTKERRLWDAITGIPLHGKFLAKKADLKDAQAVKSTAGRIRKKLWRDVILSDSQVGYWRPDLER